MSLKIQLRTSRPLRMLRSKEAQQSAYWHNSNSRILRGRTTKAGLSIISGGAHCGTGRSDVDGVGRGADELGESGRISHGLPEHALPENGMACMVDGGAAIISQMVFNVCLHKGGVTDELLNYFNG